VLGTLWVLNHPGPAELFRHQPLWGLGGPSALLLLLAAAALTLLLVRERADDRRRARDPRHSGELTLDRVTRLPNHNAILTILDNEWQNCRLNQFPLTIALIQIDHWEQINRDYGYKNGDRCLAAARQRLRKALRRADNLGRLDDGSFLLVLPGVEQQQARLIAERCQESLQVKPVQPGRRRVTLTASLGLCCGAASVQETPEDMLRKAYSALQSARETGGDRAIVYGAPIEPGLAVSEMSFA
jgi:diguanylate cyclase (GGDEF)-like protein